MDRDSAALGILADLFDAQGVLSAVDLQQALGKSQPTVSRLIRQLSARIVTLGRGRNARYGLAASIGGLPAHQPLRWTDESGRTEPWGQLHFLSGEWMHVDAPRIAIVTRAQLPWFLAPLRSQGFLGCTRARALADRGFDRDPERWSIEQQLYVIVAHLADPPGAISAGDVIETQPTIVPFDRADRLLAFDRLANDVSLSLPAGSSAAGEQAKFLARVDARVEIKGERARRRNGGVADRGRDLAGQHVLVKFTPPLGTPFGDRWHDLLHAEALALSVLADHGVATARTHVERTRTRTVLVSERFDRIGARGRRHVVALDAIHAAFVPGPRHHWAATCDALARQRRLSDDDAARVRLLIHFGRLIGNTDMHFGNLSVFVDKNEVASGRFKLAPLYDMSSMRWRPDATTGNLDLTLFEPASGDVDSDARVWALTFWRAVADSGDISHKFRALAREMAKRVCGAT